MMTMCVRAITKAKDQVDTKKAFKSLFVTNALDGSEDHLVSDRIFELVGNEIKKFRENLMQEKAPKNLKEMLKTITPPKGIRRKNTEGSELMDCEGDEIEVPVEQNESSEGESLLIHYND